MTIGEKIKRARISKGMSYADLARETGISKATLQRYETMTTKKIPIDAVAIIEAALHLNQGTLLGLDISEEKDSQAPADEVNVFQYDNIFPIATQRLPMLGEIACGQPIFANEDRESYVEVGTHIKADFCLRAKGDSMVNARILDGDIVFIKKQPSVENGEIAAVIIDDEATLKRVYMQPDKEQLMLVAENTAYAPLVFIGEELNHIHILGKAVAFQGDVK